MPEKETVATPTPGYLAMMERTRLARTLMGGIDAVRKERSKLLPPHAGERSRPDGATDSRTPYDDRVDNTTLWPFYGSAVKKTVSALLAKNIQVGTDVPEQIASDLENVDLRGNNLTVFMRQVLRDSVGMGGVSYITLDHPTVDSPGREATGADLGPGDRPYWIHIDSESLLNPEDFDYVDGRPVMRRVRYLRTLTVPDGKWGLRQVEQVRVLEPPESSSGFVRWSVYEKVGDEWPDEPKEVGTIRPLKEIPLVAVYSGYESYHRAHLMFRELAKLNLAHLRKRSDYDNTIYKICRPVLARFGVTPEEKKKGPLVMESGIIFNFTAKPGDADMRYIEHTGESLAAARADLQDLEKQQEVLSLQPHVARTAETATGRAIDHDEAKTDVRLLGVEVKDAVEQCMAIHARMRRLESGGSVNLPYLMQPRKPDAQVSRAAADIAAELGYGGKEVAAEMKRQGLFTEEMPEPPADLLPEPPPAT